jgi:hypothetical protein
MILGIPFILEVAGVLAAITFSGLSATSMMLGSGSNYAASCKNKTPRLSGVLFILLFTEVTENCDSIKPFWSGQRDSNS